MTTHYIWGGFLACVVTVVVSRAALPALRRLVPDVAGHRSSHTGVVPRGGGVAVAVGLTVGLSVMLPTIGSALATALLCLAVLFVVGLADDRSSLEVAPRLAAQTVVGVAMGLGLGTGQWWFTLTAAVFVVGWVNAFNFMDGINGISAISAALACGWYVLLAVTGVTSQTWVPVNAAATGACIGFLIWNARGRIFLGDCGSYLLGGLVAANVLSAVHGGATAGQAVAPCLIYLVDTIVTRARLAWSGQGFTSPHRQHVYQQLSRKIGHLPTTLVVAAFTLLSLSLANTGTLPQALGSIVIAGLYMSGPRLLARRVDEVPA